MKRCSKCGHWIVPPDRKCKYCRGNRRAAAVRTLTQGEG